MSASRANSLLALIAARAECGWHGSRLRSRRGSYFGTLRMFIHRRESDELAQKTLEASKRWADGKIFVKLCAIFSAQFVVKLSPSPDSLLINSICCPSADDSALLVIEFRIGRRESGSACLPPRRRCIFFFSRPNREAPKAPSKQRSSR